jgi:hypothetical protein
MVDIRHTYLPRLSVQDVLFKVLDPGFIQLAQTGLNLVTLAQALRDPTDYRRLGSLCRQVYTQCHRANPPAILTETQWADMAMTDVLREGSYIVEHQGAWVGFGLLHGTGLAQDPELGWRGMVAQVGQEVQQAAMASVLAGHIKFLQQCGVKFVRGEFDDTDPWSMLTLAVWPHHSDPQWVTWREEGL